MPRKPKKGQTKPKKLFVRVSEEMYADVKKYLSSEDLRELIAKEIETRKQAERNNQTNEG